MEDAWPVKRFWSEAVAAPAGDHWRVLLDGRPVKTQAGSAQVVTSAALAAALAGEWAAQGPTVNPDSLPLRDLADYAIDVVAADRAAAIAQLLRYGQTDTLCYRADPGEPIEARQQAVWEPLLQAAEARWGVQFIRISGVIPAAQPAGTIAQLERVLAGRSDDDLAALITLSALAASLVIALSALQPGADVAALWDAAELEEDWQAEQWGQDAEAQSRRARRTASFATAVQFAQLAGI